MNDWWHERNREHLATMNDTRQSIIVRQQAKWAFEDAEIRRLDDLLYEMETRGIAKIIRPSTGNYFHEDFDD